MIEPTPVLVLGMHRSGTSLLAGSLQAAGLHLGVVVNSAPFNKKGNKENEAIRKLNERLLNEAGYAWDRPPDGQITCDPALLEQARDLTRGLQQAGKPWGFKDPRTLFVLEGWLQLYPAARLIASFRHPSLVAQSLASRPSMPITPEQGIRLWSAYNRELLRIAQKHPVEFIHFDGDSLADGRYFKRLQALCEWLDLRDDPRSFFDQSLVAQKHGVLPVDEQADRLFSELVARCAQR